MSLQSVNELAEATQGQPLDEVRRLTHDFIKSKATKKEQLDTVISITELAGEYAEIQSEIFSEAWAMLIQNKLWEASYKSEKEALAVLETEPVRDLQKRSNTQRQRKKNYLKTIRGNWSDQLAGWNESDQRENALAAMATVSKKYKFAEAASIIKRIAMQRLHQGKSGQGSRRMIMAVDWTNFRRMSKEDAMALLDTPEPSEQELSALQMEVGALEITARRIEDVDREGEGPPKKRRRFDRKLIRGLRESSDEQNDAQVDTSDQSRSSNVSSIEATPDPGNEPSEADGILMTDDDVLSVPAEDERITLAEDEHVPSAPKSSTEERHCQCIGIRADLLDRLDRNNGVAAHLNSPDECFDMLRAMLVADGKKRASFGHLCFRHTRRISSKLGLVSKGLTKEILIKRLYVTLENSHRYEEFQASLKHANWFRLKDRVAIEADRGGVYQHVPKSLHLLAPLQTSQAQKVVEIIAGPGAWEAWERDGNLIVKNLFGWLWDGVDDGDEHESGIGDLIMEEFDMYLHHQQERNGRSNRGWLRTMYYSLIQQIMRQDIAYWALYAAMRPDRNYRLVAYPYYVKYSRPHDPCFFRHIDINIPSLLKSGRGGSTIQGAVSLTDETEGHCTVIVPGFHRHIAEWWGKVCERGQETDGHVHNVRDTYTKEDQRQFGNWERIPILHGDARITRPEIIHGSTDNEDGSFRRTILPWFVGVQEDMENLDMMESDKFSDLTLAHATQTAPDVTPSGWTNRYGAIPFRFPPTTQVYLQSPISNALVCRTSWHDPLVQEAAAVMLGGTCQEVHAMIREHRLDALRTFKRLFPKVVAGEKKIYGKDSYFLGVLKASESLACGPSCDRVVN